jgi:hypothetical protein
LYGIVGLSIAVPWLQMSKGTNKSLDHFIRIPSGWCGWYS